MPYATQQDMLDRFGPAEMVQLTDIGEPRSGAVDATVLARALGDASAEIDGYLVGRMAVPLASPPALLTVFTCDIARYRLMNTRADERAKDAYKAAIAYLTKVATGDILLMAPNEAPALAGAGAVMFDRGSKVFGREQDSADDLCSGDYWGM